MKNLDNKNKAAPAENEMNGGDVVNETNEMNETDVVNEMNEGEGANGGDEPRQKLYSEEELQQRVNEAYLRGRNEQIESRFVPDTSRLTETDGTVADTAASDTHAINPATDGSWIHTRSSVWG